jgi:hypothetical protein
MWVAIPTDKRGGFMPLVRVKIEKCIKDSQEYGSTDEHMVSRVFFTIGADGAPSNEDYCDIKQIVGSAYSSGNMEVSRPHNYRGPFDHGIFSDEIAGYFSKLVNSTGSTISLGGARNVRMMNNTFATPFEFAFTTENVGASW